VQSFTETQHPLDVYETITVVQSFADYFAGTKTGPTITDGTLDACRPPGYEFTGAHTSNSCTLTLRRIMLYMPQCERSIRTAVIVAAAAADTSIALCIVGSTQPGCVYSTLDTNITTNLT
jgi:hypothetical protein